MRRRTWICLLAAVVVMPPLAAAADSKPPAPTLSDEGTVSVPIRRGDDGRLHVPGVLHGAKLDLIIDFSNDGALFDVRKLRKLDIALVDTGQTIPTPHGKVHIHRAEVLGLEFSDQSTGRATIIAADVDAVYGVRPGTEGPDGVLGLGYLRSLGAVMDLANMRLYLRMH